MRIALLVPAPFDTVSGGYLYDRRLVEGLRALGHEVRVAELAGTFPIADETAMASARAAFGALAGDEGSGHRRPGPPRLRRSRS
jgi:hypothetical protein